MSALKSVSDCSNLSDTSLLVLTKAFLLSRVVVAHYCSSCGLRGPLSGAAGGKGLITAGLS